jgi:hypothetical protein
MYKSPTNNKSKIYQCFTLLGFGQFGFGQLGFRQLGCIQLGLSHL